MMGVGMEREKSILYGTYTEPGDTPVAVDSAGQVKTVGGGGGGGGTVDQGAAGGTAWPVSVAPLGATTDLPYVGTEDATARGVISLLKGIKNYVVGKLIVQGTVAHGSAAADAPVQMGGVAATSSPTAVDAGDVVRLLATVLGKLVTMPYSPPELVVSGCSAALTDNVATNVIAADSGASIKYYVTDIMVTNSHATVGTLVTILDSGGGKIWEGYAAPAGGGWVKQFACPVPTAANTHIHAQCGTTGSNVYVSVAAYKAP